MLHLQWHLDDRQNMLARLGYMLPGLYEDSKGNRRDLATIIHGAWDLS